jgi:hypothetical protein
MAPYPGFPQPHLGWARVTPNISSAPISCPTATVNEASPRTVVTTAVGQPQCYAPANTMTAVAPRPVAVSAVPPSTGAVGQPQFMASPITMTAVAPRPVAVAAVAAAPPSTVAAGQPQFIAPPTVPQLATQEPPASMPNATRMTLAPSGTPVTTSAARPVLMVAPPLNPVMAAPNSVVMTTAPPASFATGPTFVCQMPPVAPSVAPPISSSRLPSSAPVTSTINAAGMMTRAMKASPTVIRGKPGVADQAPLPVINEPVPKARRLSTDDVNERFNTLEDQVHHLERQLLHSQRWINKKHLYFSGKPLFLNLRLIPKFTCFCDS